MSFSYGTLTGRIYVDKITPMLYAIIGGLEIQKELILDERDGTTYLPIVRDEFADFFDPIEITSYIAQFAQVEYNINFDKDRSDPQATLKSILNRFEARPEDMQFILNGFDFEIATPVKPEVLFKLLSVLDDGHNIKKITLTSYIDEELRITNGYYSHEISLKRESVNVNVLGHRLDNKHIPHKDKVSAIVGELNQLLNSVHSDEIRKEAVESFLRINAKTTSKETAKA